MKARIPLPDLPVGEWVHINATYRAEMTDQGVQFVLVEDSPEVDAKPEPLTLPRTSLRDRLRHLWRCQIRGSHPVRSLWCPCCRPTHIRNLNYDWKG